MDDKKWQKHLGIEPYACGKESVDRDYAEKVMLSAKVLIFVPTNLKKVLVIGCGDGTEVKWLVDRGFDTRGVTRNQSEVINAKKRYGVDIEVGDMHELPYPDKQFDCLVAKDVFEHAIAPTIALREFYRVLKDDGLIILTMPSMEWAAEFYHHSVLTHKQTRIMFEKHCFELLAGPGIKSKIPLKAPITIPLGLKQGHIDVFIAKKLAYKPADSVIDIQAIQQIPYVCFLKKIYSYCPALVAKLFRAGYNLILLFKAKFY